MGEIPTAETVLYAKPAPHVALVTLNRPAKRNAIDPEMTARLEALVRRTEEDAEVRVVVLASADPAAFCAGADLAAAAAGGRLETARGGFAGFAYAQRWKPWIAAVEGAALAGGFELVLACEMIVASESARFALTEVKRGLMAAAGGAHRLGAALPRNLAYEMLATGEPMAAETAHRYGLVNRLTPAGGTLAAALALAEAIAANAPLAVQASLQTARASASLPDGVGRSIAAERFAALRLTADFKEGPRAFLEKRPPVWTGR